MAIHDRSRRSLPSFDALEGRLLLTTTSNYYSALAATVRHEYDHFVTEVQQVELQSQATPAQYLALRDDARGITLAASMTGLGAKTASARSLAVSVQIGRSILDGSFSDQAWAQEKSRLETNLAGANVPQSRIDRTIADERSVATSAGVTSDAYQNFNDDYNRVRADRSRVPAGYHNVPDPGLFYTQHLRGFFRGWAVQRTADEATLSADLRSIPAAANAAPADATSVGRDAQILENLGVPIPSTLNDQVHDAYVSDFAHGSPTDAQLTALRSRLVALLGPTATPSRVAAVERLVADAPAFFRGVGSSPANVGTIADDVRTVVNDGAGASLDPFKVTIRGVGAKG